MPMKRGAAMTPQDELDKALDREIYFLASRIINDMPEMGMSPRYLIQPLRDLALAVRDAAAKIMDNEPLMGDYEEFGDAIRKMDLPDLISALARKKVGG
jgi:hypothetical protein